jgi:hypothetical protein
METRKPAQMSLKRMKRLSYGLISIDCPGSIAGGWITHMELQPELERSSRFSNRADIVNLSGPGSDGIYSDSFLIQQAMKPVAMQTVNVGRLIEAESELIVQIFDQCADQEKQHGHNENRRYHIDCYRYYWVGLWQFHLHQGDSHG